MQNDGEIGALDVLHDLPVLLDIMASEDGNDQQMLNHLARIIDQTHHQIEGHISSLENGVENLEQRLKTSDKLLSVYRGIDKIQTNEILRMRGENEYLIKAIQDLEEYLKAA